MKSTVCKQTFTFKRVYKQQTIKYIRTIKQTTTKLNGVNTMNKKNIVKSFIELCSSVNSDKELVRGYIKIFSEEIKKFGKAKCDDMDQPMVTLYNYIDSWEFKKQCYECDNILWNFIDNMVTYAEVYVWHKDDEDYADDNRINWIKHFLD